MFRNLSPDENDASVKLVAIDGSFVARAAIPKSKIGVVLTLDGRAFIWSKSVGAYVERDTVILSHETAPVGGVIH